MSIVELEISLCVCLCPVFLVCVCVCMCMLVCISISVFVSHLGSLFSLSSLRPSRSMGTLHRDEREREKGGEREREGEGIIERQIYEVTFSGSQLE